MKILRGYLDHLKGVRGILIILKIKGVFGDFENFKDNFIILEVLVIQKLGREGGGVSVSLES